MADRLEQLESKVAQLTNTVNAMINGAKTNDELPVATLLDELAKIRGYIGGVSKIYTFKQIIDAAVLQSNTDRFITVMGFDIDGNDLTVNAGWVWNISGYSFTNPSDVEIEVPFADTGKARYDMIVADTNNNFYIVTGTEVTLPATVPTPTQPASTLLATLLYVTDDSISEPTNPDAAHQYYVGGEFETQAELLSAVAVPSTSDFGFISDVDGNILEIAKYNGTEWVFTTLGSGGGITPIPYLTLRIKAKGITSGTPNTSGTLEANDMVEGFASATEYWTTAKYNGGDVNDKANYSPIVGNTDI